MSDTKNKTTLCIECDEWVLLSDFDAEHDICKACCRIGADPVCQAIEKLGLEQHNVTHEPPETGIRYG